MFERGEYVFHESGGVCLVEDICVAPLEGMPLDREYYVMKPIHDPTSTIYVPTDSDRIFLRRLLSCEEARGFLDRIPQVEAIDEPNAKLLRVKYVEAMERHTPEDWVRVIKTVYRRSEPQGSKCRKLSETERAFGENAKRNLHTELSIALDLAPADVEGYIREWVEGK